MVINITALIIVFIETATNDDMKNYISSLYPNTYLEHESGDQGNYSYKVIIDNIERAEVYLFEPGGDNWFYGYPRYYEKSPLIFFQSVYGHEYEPLSGSEKYIRDWTRRQILTGHRPDIKWLKAEFGNEFYDTFHTFVYSLFSERLYYRPFKGSYEYRWDPKIPIAPQFETYKDEFKRIARKYLESQTAQEDFLIEYINDGLMFTPHKIAARLGLTKEYKYNVPICEIIESFIRFERSVDLPLDIPLVE